MTDKVAKTLIWTIIQTLDTHTEFDAKAISDMLIHEWHFTYPIVAISRILKNMELQRRRLTREETQHWRKKHGSQPKILYQRHSGKDPNNYERGARAKKHRRPTIAELELQRQNEEECAFCPEWDTCKGMISPCPRFPDKENAPTDRVLKLSDF